MSQAIDPAILAAIVQAVTTQLSGAESSDDATQEAPKSRKAETAAKANVVKVPTWTHKLPDGTVFRLSQAYESRPGHPESTKYRTPRVLIESKAPTGDDFRKVCTLHPDVLSVLTQVPDAKVAAFATDAREAQA